MLTARALNRTLLLRQHLLARTHLPAEAMVEHLVGLQAQETQSPYVGLWSRVEDFAPEHLSTQIASRRFTRILLMRGTIHLVTAGDCRFLRPLMQDMLERQMGSTAFLRHCADIPRSELEATAAEALASGPLGSADLGRALAARFPGHEPGHLANTVRVLLPLVQTPPRGLWKRSGGPVYVMAEQWLDSPLDSSPDPRELVRRYLRAFGPTRTADVTTWSGLTGLRPVIASMADELVTYEDERGRLLVDLPDLPLADADTPAPVRLLGRYDNVWLSHSDRDRVTSAESRARWAGRNGGNDATVFVDGMLQGLWRQRGDRVEVELFRTLTRGERVQLDAEVARLESFLAT